jgi:aminopeptidase-like protein
MGIDDSAAWRDWMLGAVRCIDPLQRLINSGDLDRAAEIVVRLLPGAWVHEYHTGTEFGTWVIPPKWRCLKGTLTDAAGRVIASTDECPLFVPFYSQSVDGWFSKKEIANHVRTRPDRPNAFPLEHRYAYNYQYQLKDWGITLPHDRWLALPEDGTYHVSISVEVKPGTLKALSLVLPGRRPETFCLNAHIDELCNDDLSGCVVAMAAMKWLKGLADRQYTYQMLLTPELVGTVAYVLDQHEQVARTVGTLNLETLGAGAELCVKQAYTPGSYAEALLRLALDERGTPYRVLGFFEGYGNDERVYEWPGVGVPSPALQRYPFAEYHTSDDTQAVISGEYLVEALDIVLSMVRLLESDWVPAYTSPVPPYLSRYGLYFDRTFDWDLHAKFNNHALFAVNGRTSVAQIAQRIEVSFAALDDYLRRFLEPGLVTFREPDEAVLRGRKLLDRTGPPRLQFCSHFEQESRHAGDT